MSNLNCLSNITYSDKIESSDKLMCDTFDVLRFPLIVMVLFIHNAIPPEILSGELDIFNETFSVYSSVSCLFSKMIGATAVPLFYFISGYLFFYRVDSFNLYTYKTKLKRRVRTLIIPYLFWNLLFIVFYLIGAKISFISHFLNREPVYGIGYVLQALVVDPNNVNCFPAAYQFWFIRDLIVCVILSPLLYLLVIKMRIGIVLILTGAWFVGLELPYLGVRGFSTGAILFFTTGAWLCVNKVNIIIFTRKLKVIAWSYPLILIIDSLTLDSPVNIVFRKIGIFVGILFCFYITAYCLERNKIKPIPFLSVASFFVFAIHDPWLLTTIRRLLLRNFSFSSDMGMTLQYFLIVIIVVSIALGIYYMLKRITPSFLALITGGR